MMHASDTATGSRSAGGIVAAEPPDIQTVPELPQANSAGWRKPDPVEYRCEIRLCPEPEGGYSVYVPELPGVVSEGETAEEAVRNIAEALRGSLRTYRQERQPIPWRKDAGPLQDDESRFWIAVNV